ncbi:MAG: histidine kinase, partial [Bacteroidales bacterium]
MNKIKYLVSFIFIFLAQLSVGQHYYTNNYTINNGLPDNNISVIFKDSKGFIWLGTNAGLVQYNGLEFNLFSSLDGLAENTVTSIAEDWNGNLWVGCLHGGISKFNGSEFITLTQQDGLINNKVTKILALPEYKILIIGTNDGISVYDEIGFTSFHVSLNNVRERLDVTDFLQKKNSVFILTCGSGLYEYFPTTREIKKVTDNNGYNYPTLFGGFISFANDTLISLGRSGFIHKQSRSALHSNLGHVECFAEDNKNIWVGTKNYDNLPNGGIYLLENNKLVNYNARLGIESKQITSLLFDDKEDILWIGTSDNGLYTFAGNNFAYYRAMDFNLNKFEVNNLHLDKNNKLWILTDRYLISKQTDKINAVFNLQVFIEKFNIFKKNELKNKYQYLNDPLGSYEKYEQLITNKSYKYPNPYTSKINGSYKILAPSSLYKPNKYDILLQKSLTKFTNIQTDTNNIVWVGSNTGVFRFNPKTSDIAYFDFEDNFFTNITVTNDNKLIASEWNNSFVYEIKDKLILSERLAHSIYNSPVNVTKTKKHNESIWFLSSDHFLFLYENYQFTLFENPDSTENYRLTDICIDSQNHIIAGGNNGKVYIFEQLNNQLKTKYVFSKLNGLSGTNIKWLECTSDNNLYIGTNLGINLIDLNDLYLQGTVFIKKYDRSSGYINYNGFVSIMGNDGILWVADNKEIVQINTNNINENDLCNCRLNLNSIEINDDKIDFKEFLKKPTTKNKSLVLPWYKNTLKFNFEIIKYLNPENVLLIYTLKKNKEIQQHETTERHIILQNLTPGHYDFGVDIYPKNPQDKFNHINFKFIIREPLYKRWWAIAGFFILLTAVIWILANWRTKQIKYQERKRLEIAEKIAELELKALRSQMNPHFIFNAMNSIQNYMLDNDVDTALSYLSDFAKLIRITLDNVSKKFVTLEEELNYLKYYLSLEQMRFDKKFEAIINLPNEFDYNQILVPPMIIQPFIENSIKHGFVNKLDKGLIKIDFFISDQGTNAELHCIIEDNGIGRAKSKQMNQNQPNKQNSRGTKITTERLALLNQTYQRKGYKIA